MKKIVAIIVIIMPFDRLATDVSEKAKQQKTVRFGDLRSIMA
jgi:hypothetical protein